MVEKVLNLVIVFVLGITYIFTYYKAINYSMKKMNLTKNNASLILLLGTIIASGTNLYHIADLSSSSFSFFYQRNSIGNGIMFYLGYFIAIWGFSFLFYKLSFIIVGYLTPENEKVELDKNNIELACLHTIVLLILTVVITPALIALASQFIPYPEMPF